MIRAIPAGARPFETMSEDRKIQSLERAVAQAGDDIELRALLAEALHDAGRLDDAERHYKAGLKLAAGHHGLTLGLVRVLCSQGRQEAALHVLDAHVELTDPVAEVLVEHARLLLAADRKEEAAARYQQAIAASPESTDAFLALRLGLRHVPGAIHGGRERVPAGDAGTPGAAEELVEAERPRITFRDVGGMDAVKKQIRLKIIHPLSNPELYKSYGKAAGGGILLYGPPGCGKTHLARATAGEIDSTFLAVGIHEVLEMWIGQSERNLHSIFEQARRKKPAVLFFDEVDALGASRTDMRGAAGRQVINQFLAELDGVQSSNEGVLVLAATNAPWHMDSAFRRPGRFDRVIFVPPPDLEARARILELQCLGRPVEGVDFEQVAKRTDHFSGADLKALVDTAVEGKLEAALERGSAIPITTKDLIAALKQVRPTTREWFATAKNYVLYSNEGGLYDDVRAYLDLV
jgi:SpoVK/Ycf46/Vps4 family AAA+-type ATPase